MISPFCLLTPRDEPVREWNFMSDMAESQRACSVSLSRETNFVPKHDTQGNLLSGDSPASLSFLGPFPLRVGRGARSTLVEYMVETELHKAARDGESSHHHFQHLHEPFCNHSR